MKLKNWLRKTVANFPLCCSGFAERSSVATSSPQNPIRPRKRAPHPTKRNLKIDAVARNRRRRETHDRRLQRRRPFLFSAPPLRVPSGFLLHCQGSEIGLWF